MRRVVCYGATRNLYHEMTVAAKSLLRYTKVDRVIFLTEDDEFPEELRHALLRRAAERNHHALCRN